MSTSPSDPSPSSPPVADSPGSKDTTARPGFGGRAADALRYWEPRRWLYNLALAAVVAAHYAAGWPATRVHLDRDTLLTFFMLGVLANIAYCAAYLVDLFVQFSALGVAWGRWRWTVLATGTAFGCVIAHFMTMALVG